MTFWNTALPGTPFMVQIGEAVAGFWEKIGVKVEMKTVEWGVFDPMGRGEQKGLVGTASMYRTAGRPEPSPRYADDAHLDGRPAPARRSRRTAPPCARTMDKAYEAVVSREGRREARRRDEPDDRARREDVDRRCRSSRAWATGR